MRSWEEEGTWRNESMSKRLARLGNSKRFAGFMLMEASSYMSLGVNGGHSAW